MKIFLHPSAPPIRVSNCFSKISGFFLRDCSRHCEELVEVDWIGMCEGFSRVRSPVSLCISFVGPETAF